MKIQIDSGFAGVRVTVDGEDVTPAGARTPHLPVVEHGRAELYDLAAALRREAGYMLYVLGNEAQSPFNRGWAAACQDSAGRLETLLAKGQ